MLCVPFSLFYYQSEFVLREVEMVFWGCFMAQSSYLKYAFLGEANPENLRLQSLSLVFLI